MASAGPYRSSDVLKQTLEYLDDSVVHGVRLKKIFNCWTACVYFEKCEFIPLTALKQYFPDASKISALLRVLYGLEPSVSFDTTTIHEHYLRTFCLLISIGWGQYISRFVAAKIDDRYLPFGTYPGNDSPVSCSEDNLPIFEPNVRASFLRAQWKFCPYDIRRHHTFLHELRILPITSVEILSENHGTTVAKVQILQEYNFSTSYKRPTHSQTFVLKSSLRGSVEDCEQAVRLESDLQRGNRFCSVNVLKPVKIFVQSSVVNSLQEYADGGSLEQHFRFSFPPITHAGYFSFWSAVSDVIIGARLTHESVSAANGAWSRRRLRHQLDITLSDILLFSPETPATYKWSFKIADRGPKYFEPVPGYDGSVSDLQGKKDATYSSPEKFRATAEKSDGHGLVLPSDVWSIACILSIAATWLVGGPELVERFAMLRRDECLRLGLVDVDCFHDGYKVLSTVENWHRALVEYARKTDNFTARIWPCVLRQAFEGEPTRRSTVSQLRDSVLELAAKQLVANTSDIFVDWPILSDKSWDELIGREDWSDSVINALDSGQETSSTPEPRSSSYESSTENDLLSESSQKDVPKISGEHGSVEPNFVSSKHVVPRFSKGEIESPPRLDIGTPSQKRGIVTQPTLVGKPIPFESQNSMLDGAGGDTKSRTKSGQLRLRAPATDADLHDDEQSVQFMYEGIYQQGKTDDDETPNSALAQEKTPISIGQEQSVLPSVASPGMSSRELNRLLRCGNLQILVQSVRDQRNLPKAFQHKRVQRYLKLGYSDQKVAELLLEAAEAAEASGTPSEYEELPKFPKKEGRKQSLPPQSVLLDALTCTQPETFSSKLDIQPQRVTWTCACGAELFDDYVEIVPGSLKRLERRLRNENQRPSHHWLLRWFGVRSMLTENTIAGGSGQVELSPIQANFQNPNQHNQRSTLTDPFGNSSSVRTDVDRAQGVSSTATIPTVLYLLLCLPTSLSGVRLHHEQLLSAVNRDTPRNDRQLFQILRKAYLSQKSTITSKLSLRTVTQVSLARFIVDLSQFVDLKPHSAFCTSTSDGCDCIPPKDLLLPAPTAEYVCNPTEPEFSPPIGISYLTHAFQHPELISQHSEWVLNQIPKRVSGQLMAVSGIKPIKGWGLAFEEGWDRRRIRRALLILAGMGSLIFGILWSVFKQDIESAFAVAAYWVAFFALAGGYYGTAEASLKAV